MNVNNFICRAWFHLFHWKSNMENLSNDTLIPIIHGKELDIKSFIMGFHEYSTIWMLHKNEVLHARMELTNKKEKLLLL